MYMFVAIHRSVKYLLSMKLVKARDSSYTNIGYTSAVGTNIASNDCEGGMQSDVCYL